MDKKKVTNEVIISQFVNAKDKNIKLDSLQDLIREGSVTEFCFIYTKPKDSKKTRYISTRIIKLDLYDGIVTTVNGRKFKILNEIEVNPKRKVGE